MDNGAESSPGLILYDFDGTLARTLEAGMEIYNGIAEENGFARVEAGDIPRLRELGIPTLLRELGIPLTRLPGLVRRIRSGLRGRMAEVSPVQGIPEVIRELGSRGFRQAIVTSNAEENVRAFLLRNDLDIFESVHSGSSLFSKGRILRRILGSAGVAPERAVYVGDEIRDVEAAREAGIRMVAVTWGANSRTALLAAGPDGIAERPSDLVVFWEFEGRE